MWKQTSVFENTPSSSSIGGTDRQRLLETEETINAYVESLEGYDFDAHKKCP